MISLLFFNFTFFLISCADKNVSDNTETTNTNEENSVLENDKDTVDTTGQSAAQKPIDIYIIAGQSNACGYTKIDETVLAELWDKYKVGDENVLYAGRAEYTSNVNTPQVSTLANEVQWTTAKAGQGKTTSQMGAEVGMAKILSEEYYTGNKTAGIIKLAHGGTSLIGGTGGENATNGNWVPPSYAESKGWSYDGIHGGLYRALLKQVEKNISELREQGYDNICIKGVFWMQGESDSTNQPIYYEKAFKCLVNDLRRDLGEINNEDLSELPIMIGEISRTFGSAANGQIETNEMFFNTQRKLAEQLDNVYIIASGQYEINTWDSTLETSVMDPFQQDTSHWNTECMFKIGELVGRCIIDNIFT